MANEKDDKETRRGALRTLVVVGSAAFGCALAAPAVVFVAAPLDAAGGGKPGEKWVKTLREAQLAENEPKKVSIVADQRDAWMVAKDVELGAVWLVRRGGKILAFSVVCPHLGCSINADARGQGFGCPCHTSAFDADGKKISGPAPRDMDPLATKVEDGWIHVDFHRFRIGVPERVEIGA